jgi:hypothetical protein
MTVSFNWPPKWAQFLSSDCTADLSDDYSPPFLRELLAHPKQMIDLILDDDNDDNNDIPEISWLSITPTA